MPVPALAKRNPDFRQADIERCALFSEAPFRTIAPGNGYVQGKFGGVFRDGFTKGKTFTIPGPKKLSALNQGLFSDFVRIRACEGYTDNKELVMRDKAAQAQFRKNKQPWRPPAWPKKSSGKGSIYGTISNKYEYVSPKTPPKAAKGGPGGDSAEKKLGRNFLTNPGKLGTGYGYANIAINKYPPYMTSTIDPKKNRTVVDAELTAEHEKRKGAFRTRVPDNRAFWENPWHDDLQNDKKPAEMLPYLRPPQPRPPRPDKAWQPTQHNRKGKLAAFEKYPPYMTNPYQTAKVMLGNSAHPTQPNKEGKRWIGSWLNASERTYYTESLLKKALNKQFNLHNLDTYKPKYFPLVADRLIKQRKPHLRYARKEDALSRVPQVFRLHPSPSLGRNPYVLRKTRRRPSNIVVPPELKQAKSVA